MKKFTQAEFERFEVVDDFKVCPTGDYTDIKAFGECCSFGKSCSFGECCSFGKYCSFSECCSFGEHCNFGEWCNFGEYCSFGECCSFENNKDLNYYYAVDRIGSERRKTYFFYGEKAELIRCGCFTGTLKEFEEQIKMTHNDNKKYLAEYMLAVKFFKGLKKIKGVGL